MEFLKIYDKKPKIRLGREGDGGYIIADGYSYDLLIGCGIKDDVSFEIDFLNRNPDIFAFTFDGTISELPETHERLYFIKKNISDRNTKTTTNLHKLIENHERIFLKMDIEEAEFEWINSLTKAHLRRFKQIVIEFHFPFTSERMKILNKMNTFHKLIHFHPNNCCGTVEINGKQFPRVFECTYLLTNEDLTRYKGPIPSPLDNKNVKDKDEISLDFHL